MAPSSTSLRSEAKREAATWKDRFQERLPGPVRRIVAEARANDVFLLAASLAFYAFVSIAPLSIVVLRSRALFSVLLIPVFVVGGLVACYAGSQALGGEGLGRVLGAVAALGIAFVTAGVGLVIIYRIYPPSRLSWPAIRRAVLWTATTDAVLSALFVLYLSSGADVRQHYVTTGVATLVLLAVWLFLGNVMMLVGYRIGADTGSRRA